MIAAFSTVDWWELIGVMVLIAGVGVMAASETAITRTNRARAYKLVDEKRRGAQSLLRIVENVAPYLNVVLLLTLLATIGGTTLATILATRHLENWGEGVSTGRMTLLLFIVAAPVDSSMRAVLDLVLRHGYSRIPVYRGTIDEVEGVVYAKDMLRHLHAGKESVPLQTIMREPFFVPETKKVDELLREMQARRGHIALVTDEYGSLAGLVTIEDLLEELVGEIADEYDREEPQMEPVDDHTYRVNGRLSIDEVNELLDVELPHDEWDTVAGLMYELLGAVPTQGETVTYDNLTFTAEKVQGRRIAKVLIKRKPPEESGQAVE